MGVATGPAAYWEFKLRNRISHPLEQRLKNGERVEIRECFSDLHL